MQNSVPVALVYGETESSEGLRQALGEIGANLVCDLDVDSFSVDNLGASGAGVVLTPGCGAAGRAGGRAAPRRPGGASPDVKA